MDVEKGIKKLQFNVNNGYELKFWMGVYIKEIICSSN